mmetsp:Transcript_20549/g.57067  ORF Transcript_20549/g.57067 Transcript_20549/m.57067 type:complete len:253 (-) Transcript_20549:81-839(-)
MVAPEVTGMDVAALEVPCATAGGERAHREKTSDQKTSELQEGAVGALWQPQSQARGPEQCFANDAAGLAPAAEAFILGAEEASNLAFSQLPFASHSLAAVSALYSGGNMASACVEADQATLTASLLDPASRGGDALLNQDDDDGANEAMEAGSEADAAAAQDAITPHQRSGSCAYDELAPPMAASAVPVSPPVSSAYEATPEGASSGDAAGDAHAPGAKPGVGLLDNIACMLGCQVCQGGKRSCALLPMVFS